MAEAITEFSGDHRFLSNFWAAPIQFGEWRFPTAEHAYQAAKSNDPAEWALMRDCGGPAAAKKLGRKLTLRPDWEQVKVTIMSEILAAKFAPGTELAARLVATGDAELIEGNHWGDTFWGVCRGKGENTLGKLLMKQRETLIKGA